MDRRSLLKLFGAGAVIAPVVNGIAMNDPQARLIVTPDVEIVPPTLEASPLLGDFRDTESMAVTVYIRHKKSGLVSRIDCESFIASVGVTRTVDVTDVTSTGNYRHKIPMLAPPEFTFTCSGNIRVFNAYETHS